MRAAKKEKKSLITEKMSVKITYIANFSIKLFKSPFAKSAKIVSTHLWKTSNFVS